ncbi:MAG: DoxX family membrane protein [Bacteroidales bacterium]|nr:DoxX family membrane protein [Bacteroidales bacterium]
MKWGNALKLTLGFLFLLSAFSKFVDIDSFEIYVYSLGFVGQAFSQVASRLVITGEVLLGVMLISGRWHKLTMACTALLLLGFTLLLAYLAMSGHTDSCHCMGELMPFSPAQSILKNALLLMVTLAAYRFSNVAWRVPWWLAALLAALPIALTVMFGYKGLVYLTGFMRDYLIVWLVVLPMVAALAVLPALHRWWVTLLLALAPVATLFIQNAPDNWLNNTPAVSYDKEMLLRQTQVGGPLADAYITTGRHVVALYSSSCHYCQRAAAKIGTIQQQAKLPDSAFVNVFPLTRRDGKAHPELFYAQSRSPQYHTLSLPADTFLHITKGRFPLILLMRDGTVDTAIDYRDITERYLIEFLK